MACRVHTRQAFCFPRTSTSGGGYVPVGLKRAALTKTQERRAYAAATERDQGRCQRCGRQGPTDRDHRQGRDRFNTTVANLQLLGGDFGCGCHRWKTEHPREALLAGFTVPRWADPTEWPAHRHGVGWVIYFNEQDEKGEWWQKITEERARELMRGIHAS